MTNEFFPKVEVFLSSYNGEKYIQEQIESILNQNKVDVLVTVRDDGSNDGTVSILKEIEAKYPERVQMTEEKNIGYRRSFLRLLSYANSSADYFAYADQDDIWEPDKLQQAITFLERNSKSWLYASALKITDSDLNVISVKCPTDVRQSLGSFFVRTRLAGCTMVFKRELLNIALKYSDLELSHETSPDHDALLCMLSMLYGKEISIDAQAYILHRRHESAETSGGRGIKNRLDVEWKRIIGRKYSFQNTAKLLLKEPCATSKNPNYKLLKEIEHYDDNIISVIRLCFDKRISCGIIMADLLMRLKMLLRYY